MAVVRAANVISASADADVIAGPLRLCGIKGVAGAGGLTVALRKGSVSGAILHTMVLGASEDLFEDVVLRVPSAGLYVQISAGAGSIYLYSE